MATKKKRVMITVSDEMAQKIEYYSNKIGVTQSALCSQFVGQSIMAFDKTYDLLESSMQHIADESFKQHSKSEE